MWLLVLLVVKGTNILLEAGYLAWLLVGYSLVTRWLLVQSLLQLFDAASHEVPN